VAIGARAIGKVVRRRKDMGASGASSALGVWRRTAGAWACAACAAWVLTGGAAATISSAGVAPPGQYRLDPLRSGVTLDVEYLLHTRLTMHIRRMRAWLTGVDDGFASARVDVKLDASSVEANMPFVAGIVEGDDMLDAARYPDISFVSTHFVRTGVSSGLLTGALTIRSTTRPVTLSVTFDRAPHGPADGTRALAFSADGHFSRSSFGLSRWPSAVGDDVHLRIQAEFVRERANP
jgi:polyisoprenoid-binding protein YceI